MRTTLQLIVLPVLLTLTGCGGSEFTQSTPPAGAGGAASDASVDTGGSGGTNTGGSDTGGTGGSTVPCQTPAECPGTDTECQHKACNNGVCSMEFAGPGAPIATQQPGDCLRSVCDGQGNVINQVDNMDVPVDGNPCTDDVCNNGVPRNPSTAAGATCGNGLTCDGEGHCTGCTSASQCGSGGRCFDWTCMTDGTCVMQPVSDGTSCGPCMQCKSGTCENVPSGEDPNNECDLDDPSTNPCGQDGQCNGSGACRYRAPGTLCEPAAYCDGDTAVLPDECDGHGTCIDGGSQPCWPFRCVQGACRTTCATKQDCAPGTTCTADKLCVDCVLCEEWYENPAVLTANWCPTNSKELTDMVAKCACGILGQPGKCATACGGNNNLCSTFPKKPSSDCNGCIQKNCANEIISCVQDAVE